MVLRSVVFATSARASSMAIGEMIIKASPFLSTVIRKGRVVPIPMPTVVWAS